MLHYAKLATGVASAALCLVPCFAQRSTPDVDKVANWPAPLYWQRPAPSGQPDSSGRIAPGRETAQATETAQVGEAAVFVAITPCRLADTRNNGTFPYPSTFGGPSMTAGRRGCFRCRAARAACRPWRWLIRSTSRWCRPARPCAG